MIDLPELSAPLRNHPRLLKLWKRSRSHALSVLPAPNYARLHPVRDLRAALPRVRFERPSSRVEGWLSEDEQAALYLLARHTTGPVIEIGSWLGKSAICLAQGLRDSTSAHRNLTCCELFPTEANFREVGPNQIGFFYPINHPDPMGLVTREDYEQGILSILVRPGGLRGGFEKNLRDAGLWEKIQLHEADFRSLKIASPCAMVFCDAMHDENEIRRNSPDLVRLLAPGSILCCHDTSPSNARMIREYFKFEAETQIDSILVGTIAQMFPAGNAPA